MRSKVYGGCVTVTPQEGAPQKSTNIGEAAQVLGASVHSLRSYEREGLLSVPRQDARPAPENRNTQRRYGQDELGLQARTSWAATRRRTWTE